jgi:hypothetical protein
MLQMATDMRFMEASSNEQRQFMTSVAQWYLLNATSWRMRSLHSVRRVFFWSCWEMRGVSALCITHTHARTHTHTHTHEECSSGAVRDVWH